MQAYNIRWLGLWDWATLEVEHICLNAKEFFDGKLGRDQSTHPTRDELHVFLSTKKRRRGRAVAALQRGDDIYS